MKRFKDSIQEQFSDSSVKNSRSIELTKLDGTRFIADTNHEFRSRIVHLKYSIMKCYYPSMEIR